MSCTSGTTRKNSSRFFPQRDKSYDGTGTDQYMQLDVDTSVEEPDPTPTNPRSSNYDLRLNPQPNCNDD